MPKMSKTIHIEASVEQFLNACSLTELHEIDALLMGAIKRASQKKLKESRTPRPHQQWMMTEVSFLRENYNKLTIKELCAHLKRSRYNIVYMAAKLGLKKEKKFFQMHKRKEISHE